MAFAKTMAVWDCLIQIETSAAGTTYFEPGGVFIWDVIASAFWRGWPAAAGSASYAIGGGVLCD